MNSDLDAYGCARLPCLLDPAECADIATMWDSAAFRSRIDMGAHGYGAGAYRYFAYPLPPVIERLRGDLYARLVGVANDWSARLGRAERYPDTLAEFLARCHTGGQARPTPLLLRYAAGDYNRLHQDVYGSLAFPLQVAVLLSAPGEFEGGEFVLTETRARMQSRAEVVPLGQGDAVIFANAARPVASARGDTRVQHRHGVSRLRSGTRMTLGLIFHDAA